MNTLLFFLILVILATGCVSLQKLIWARAESRVLALLSSLLLWAVVFLPMLLGNGIADYLVLVDVDSPLLPCFAYLLEHQDWNLVALFLGGLAFFIATLFLITKIAQWNTWLPPILIFLIPGCIAFRIFYAQSQVNPALLIGSIAIILIGMILLARALIWKAPHLRLGLLFLIFGCAAFATLYALLRTLSNVNWMAASVFIGSVIWIMIGLILLIRKFWRWLSYTDASGNIPSPAHEEALTLLQLPRHQGRYPILFLMFMGVVFLFSYYLLYARTSGSGWSGIGFFLLAGSVSNFTIGIAFLVSKVLIAARIPVLRRRIVVFGMMTGVVLGFSYYILTVIKIVPGDEAMIAHFQAHQSKFEEIVRIYREYVALPKKKGNVSRDEYQTQIADFVKMEHWSNTAHSLSREIGLNGTFDINSLGTAWFSEPYRLGNVEAMDADELYRFRNKYAVIEFSLAPQYPWQTYRQTCPFYDCYIQPPYSKRFVFFPSPPCIRNGVLFGPVEKGGVVRRWGYILPSLNALLLYGWHANESAFRQIDTEGHWFLALGRDGRAFYVNSSPLGIGLQSLPLEQTGCDVSAR